MRLLADIVIGDEFTPAQKFGSLADFIYTFSKIIALGGGFLIIASFVYAAYLYLSAAGKKENIEKAGTMLTNTIIGMIVIVTAYWITQIIARFLGQSFGQ